MRTVELRSYSFPDLETRKVENQTNKGPGETQDFVAILHSVQKENTPREEIQSMQENEPVKREDSPILEEPQSSLKKESPDSPVQDDFSEESQVDENKDSVQEIHEKPKMVIAGEQKAGSTLEIESANTGEEIPDPESIEFQIPLQSGLSLVSLLNPKSEVEQKEEIFLNRISSAPKETLQPPKEKFSSDEKKETNELLKSMFVEKNSKQKQDEKPRESKIVEESSKTPITSAKLVVDEWKHQAQGALKSDEGVKFNNLFQNISGELQEVSEKKAKNNSRVQRLSENLERKSDDSQSPRINSKEIQQIVQKSQGIETVSITEKLKRSEPVIKKEKEQSSSPVPQQAAEPNVLTKEKSNPNIQIAEPRIKSSESKAEVRGTSRPQETARNFQEIVRAAKFQIVENGKNSAEILLQPKELGRVTLLVSEENSRLEGKIFVETDSAKLMILSELQNLKADLKTSGLELFELTVDIRDENFMRFSSSEEKKGEERAGYTGKGSSEVDTETEADSPNTATDRILDIKV